MVEAVISLRIDVRSIEADGSPGELDENALLGSGISKVKFITVSGKDKDECLINLRKKLKNI
jgi:hypothetical protein